MGIPALVVKQIKDQVACRNLTQFFGKSSVSESSTTSTHASSISSPSGALKSAKLSSFTSTSPRTRQQKFAVASTWVRAYELEPSIIVDVGSLAELLVLLFIVHILKRAQAIKEENESFV